MKRIALFFCFIFSFAAHANNIIVNGTRFIYPGNEKEITVQLSNNADRPALAQAWLDPGLAREVEGALGKILSVLPPAARLAAEAQALYAPLVGLDARTQATLQALREAVQSCHVVEIDYADVQGRPSLRRLRPLGCFYWGKVWTLSAWCELRNDFRGFRIDRIAAFTVLPERFRQEPGKTLADLLRQVEAEREGWPLECVAAPGADGRS
mgnify:CR=1 FL=1